MITADALYSDFDTKSSATSYGHWFTAPNIQGVADEVDKKKLVKAFKKEFACNGAVTTNKELGEIILLQGDHRKDVVAFLAKNNIAKKENIKVHGF